MRCGARSGASTIVVAAASSAEPAPVAVPPSAAATAAPPVATDSAATGAPSAGLRYRLIQQRPDGTEVDVDTATTFHSGDKLKLSFESNIAGYLYVALQGSSGNWTVLFPSAQINGGRNLITPLEQYDVPSDGGWFRFDENVGTETLFVFLSREPLDQLPGFARPGKAETLTASVVQDLRQSVRPGVKQAT